MVGLPITELFDLIAKQNTGLPRFEQFLSLLRDRIIDGLCCDIGYAQRQGQYTPVIHSHSELQNTIDFEEKGIFTAQIEPSILQQFLQRLEPYKAKIRDNYQKGLTDRDSLSINQIDRPTFEFLNQILQHYKVTQCISNARSESLTSTGFALELSVPEAKWWRSRYPDFDCENQNTAYYHTDESPDIMKAILYLNDVTEENGPFTMIPESYQWQRESLSWVTARTIDAMGRLMDYEDLPPKILGHDRHLLVSALGRQHFMALPPELQTVSHFGNDVLKDSEIERILVSHSSSVVGERGTIIAFDGSRIVHRGGLVQCGERWVCQIIFCGDRRNTIHLQKHWRDALKSHSSNFVIL
jgi:Phytanoyl-CoA dioxygenase (PhyH)